MSLQPSIDGPESRQLFYGKVPRTGKRTVIDRGNMPIGKEEEVLSRAVHIEDIRAMVQLIEEQGREELSTPQRPAWMTRLCSVNHANNVPPYLSSGGFELMEFHMGVFDDLQQIQM